MIDKSTNYEITFITLGDGRTLMTGDLHILGRMIEFRQLESQVPIGAIKAEDYKVQDNTHKVVMVIKSLEAAKALLAVAEGTVKKFEEGHYMKPEDYKDDNDT